MDNLACRDPLVDPEWFFPTASVGTDAYDVEAHRARMICGGCPVRLTCLEFALAQRPTRDRFGIVGGLDPDERHDMRVARAAAAAARVARTSVSA